MCGLEVCYAFCLIYSSYVGGYYSLEVEEIYTETPVYIGADSPQFQAFIKSVDFKKFIDNLETLTSIPNFPYITTEEIQVLSEIAKKLRLIDCEFDYDDTLSNTEDYDQSE